MLRCSRRQRTVPIFNGYNYLMRWFVAVLVISVCAVGLVVSIDAWRFLNQPSSLTESVVITVPQGASFSAVVDRLEHAGLFNGRRYQTYFTAYAIFRGQASRIKSGEYQIQPRATPLEILHKLVIGNTKQYSLTIIEGWRFQELFKAMKRHDAIKMTLICKSPSQIMAAIGAKGKYPEGWFLPNTYFFPRGTTDAELLSRSYQAMQQLLESEWDKRATGLPLDSPYEALILEIGRAHV